MPILDHESWHVWIDDIVPTLSKKQLGAKLVTVVLKLNLLYDDLVQDENYEASSKIQDLVNDFVFPKVK